MSPSVLELDHGSDAFDLDFRVGDVADVTPRAGLTSQCPGPTISCWSQSCTQCCASSDWRTGC